MICRKREIEFKNLALQKYQKLKNKQLLRVSFGTCKYLWEESKTRASRSKLYAYFSSWKMYAREKALLKKYLRESKLDEQLAYTPTTTQRKRNKEPFKATPISMSISEFSKSDLSNTLNNNSPY